jgi:hypothetical protein
VIPQRFPLDRTVRYLYLALAVSGCAGTGVGKVAPSALPAGMGPATQEQVAAFVAGGAPQGLRQLRFKFKFKDSKGKVGGRGAARVAAPDSVRLDMQGPFGLGKGAAMVVGDSTEWIRGPDAIKRVIPDFRLLWSMLGYTQPPPSGAGLAASEAGDVTAWSYATAEDTVEYVRTGGSRPTLVALVRKNGAVLGRSETSFGPDGTPMEAQLLVPGASARLDLTFTESTSPATFKSDTWVRGDP